MHAVSFSLFKLMELQLSRDNTAVSLICLYLPLSSKQNKPSNKIKLNIFSFFLLFFFFLFCGGGGGGGRRISCTCFRIIIIIIKVFIKPEILSIKTILSARTHARTHARARARTHTHTHTSILTIQNLVYIQLGQETEV